MTEATQQKNWAPWLGFLLALVAVLINIAFFVSIPGHGIISWFSVFLAVIAVAFVAMGIQRAYLRSQEYRGKVSSIVLGVLSLALCVFAVMVFVGARKVPASSGALQAGQKAPEFTLEDTNGKMVSLTQLLAKPDNGPAPKAVLLIFYRGWW